MVWKIVLVFFATVFVLLVATSIWSYFSRGGADAMDFVAFKILVLRSPFYWLMVLVVVSIAGWLLRYWLTQPHQ